MKISSILIIGLGRFGKHLCHELAKLHNDIMIIDKDESKLTDLVGLVNQSKIGDCTNPEVLKGIGISNFDYVVVAIDDNFQSSLEITCLCKELGAKFVFSKADRDVAAKFLAKNGADQVIYPEADMAKRLAIRLTANHIFDVIEFGNGYSMYEIELRNSWVGKTLKDLNFANKYHLNVIGVKTDGVTQMLPGADRKFVKDEHVLVIGTYEDVQKAIKG